MKITLVIMGGLLVVAPLVADYLLKTSHQANVVRLLDRPEAQRVTLQKDEIHSGLSFGCWLTGAVMIATGIYLTIRESKPAQTLPSAPVSHAPPPT